jgi:hypothetical protein
MKNSKVLLYLVFIGILFCTLYYVNQIKTDLPTGLSSSHNGYPY